MKKCVLKFLSIAAVLFAGRVAAVGSSKDDVPRFVVLVSPTEESALTMKCQPDDEAETNLKCSFTQKMILRGVKNGRSLLVDQLSRADIKAIRKDCSMYSGSSPTPLNPVMKPRIEEEGRGYREFCNCVKSSESKKCVEGYQKVLANIAQRKCRVISNDFEFVLKQVTKGKYLSEVSPKGMCNYVTIVVLEKTGPNKTWKYSQTRLSGDEGPLCVLNLNKPEVYFESYDTDFPGCDFISVGP